MAILEKLFRMDTFLSDRIFSGSNTAVRLLRRIANRLNAKRFFGGRSIGLIARKMT